VDQRAAWVLTGLAGPYRAGEDPLHSLEVGDARTHVLQVRGREIPDLRAGRLAAGGERQQRANLVQREAQLPRPTHEAQAAHVVATVAAIAAAPGRGRHQADPLVVADRLDVAARAA